MRPASSLGYSLIELLITITIASLILSISVAGYNNFQKSRQVKEVTLTLQSDLRFAQSQAFGGVKPTGVCNGITQSLYGWVFTATNADLTTNKAGGYSIAPRCIDVTVSPVQITDGPSAKTVSFPSGVTMTWNPGYCVVFLSVNRGTVDCIYSQVPVIRETVTTLTLSNGDASSDKKVTVKGVGDIVYAE